MPTLTIKTIGGRELDRVSFYDGRLEFDTGAARDLFEGREPLDAFERLSGWSNGYITAELDASAAPNDGN